VHWYAIWRLNERTHRKLLIVDGRAGFTGGVGVADEWDGDADRPDRWRDSHYRVEGPAVAQLQSAFMDNWTKTHSRVLHGEPYFPRPESAGDHVAQVFMSSPSQGAESMPMMYLLSFAAARESIRLATAYFAPDDLFLDSLAAAARRGVRVRLLLPGPRIDTQVVRRAGRACFGKLLEAGVEIYEYQPCMLHNKLLVVDDRWVSVGSTNCDNRSLRLNDEANLNVLDEPFAHEQADVFDRDLQRSRRITLEEWRRRPWKEKLAERAARLLRPQL
jgi:cardiolipin synthase